MATKRATQTQPAGVHVSAEDLERGTVTVNHQHTISKVVGDNSDDMPTGLEPISVQDLETMEWLIYRQEDDGWVFKDKYPGRPYEPDLRDYYGHGRYRVMPEGPDGRPMEKFATILKVGRATQHSDDEDESEDTPVPVPVAQQMGSMMDPMLQFMSLQMQMTATREAEAARRDEARRRSDQERDRLRREQERERDERRQARDEKREEERQAREEVRQDRLEREARLKAETEAAERQTKSEADAEERRAKAESDAEERRARLELEAANRQARAELTSTLLTAGMGALSSIGSVVLENRNSNTDPRPAQGDNVSERLLDGFLKIQSANALASRTPAGSSGTDPRQAIEMLVLLDQLASNRAQAQMPHYADDDDDDDDGVMDMLMKAAPVLQMLRGGAMPQPDQGGAQQADPASLASNLIANPKALAAVAMQDPDMAASSFIAAVKGNPTLEAAVMRAMEEADDIEPVLGDSQGGVIYDVPEDEAEDEDGAADFMSGMVGGMGGGDSSAVG